MCQKKPGPRCYSHLSEDKKAIDSALDRMQKQHTDHTERAKELAHEAKSSSDPKEVARLEAETNEEREAALDVAENLSVLKAKKKDTNSRLLGTKTGQKNAYARVEELKEEGASSHRASHYEKQIVNAREEHEKSLRYANWADKVNKGEVPGKFVSSEGTQQDPYLGYSGDPLYHATTEEVTILSGEELEMTQSSRYGMNAITPVTREKIEDEIHNRSERGERSRLAETKEKHGRLARDLPEQYKAVVQRKHGDNYLHLDTTESDHKSNLLTAASSLSPERTVRTSNGEQLSYGEVFSRTESKSPLQGGRRETKLLLDDGSTVEVNPVVYKMLRIDGNKTGLTTTQWVK